MILYDHIICILIYNCIHLYRCIVPNKSNQALGTRRQRSVFAKGLSIRVLVSPWERPTFSTPSWGCGASRRRQKNTPGLQLKKHRRVGHLEMMRRHWTTILEILFGPHCVGSYSIIMYYIWSSKRSWTQRKQQDFLSILVRKKGFRKHFLMFPHFSIETSGIPLT